MKKNVRLVALLAFLILPICSSGCALFSDRIRNAVKVKIREAAYKGADKVVDRTLDRLELSPEARAEVEPKVKAIVREEIDKVLGDEQIDEANKSDE